MKLSNLGHPGLGWRLDAEAELDVVVDFVAARMGVEVVGGAAVEFVTLAQLAAYEKADGDGTEAGGDPAEGEEPGGFFFFRSLHEGGQDFRFAGEETGWNQRQHVWMIPQDCDG